jgi:PBSX family phage terminase large subunit
MNEVTLQAGPNFEFIHNNFDFDKSEKQEKQLFSLRGSSGSGKTFDILQWIITYCQAYEDWGKDILIGRDQYSDCKKTVLKDFIKILKLYGIYNVKNHGQSHPQTYKLYGNYIYFSGLNGIGSHGERHDIVFVNEVLETTWDDVSQLNQRCNELLICDYNPSVTFHWFYNKIEGREECQYFHSTLLMNPFLPRGQRNEILAYEPTHPEDRELDKELRREHPTNIKNGTADDYLWDVYGLGLKASAEGLIFQNVNYIDEWPQDIAPVHGLDFGFTVDPSALVKVGENKTDIFLELLMYEPTETASEIDQYAEKVGISKHIPCTADSSDKYTGENKGTVEMVKELKKLGWRIEKVSKTKSVMFWLLEMKKKKINIVKNNLVHHARTEQENYRMKTVNGIAINQPESGFDHFWDSSRYGFMSLNTSTIYPSKDFF